MFRKTLLAGLVLAGLVVPLATRTPEVAASSHREAPLISQDPLADNTDLYAFVSPDRPDTAADPAVWAYAASHGLVIVSKDSDFQHRALLLGHPPKVIWVRLGNCSMAAVAALLRARQSDVLAFEADPAASLLALS